MKAVFSAADGSNGNELRISDGTTADDGGGELWITDGTTAGTRMLGDLSATFLHHRRCSHSVASRKPGHSLTS